MDIPKSSCKPHEDVYQASVRDPMGALPGGLGRDFGKAKIFRPFRDVRFAKDKTPYKTHQGAFVGAGPACGWYVEIAARGVRTGAGFYHADAASLGRIRASIADDVKGKELQRILAKLEKAGVTVAGDRLKTATRGYAAEHPPI